MPAAARFLIFPPVRLLPSTFIFQLFESGGGFRDPRYVGYALTTVWEGSEAGEQQIIGFDMGGTSTDVSRYAGTYEHVFESTTAGTPLHAHGSAALDPSPRWRR